MTRRWNFHKIGCQRCGIMSPLLKRKGYYVSVCRSCKVKLNKNAQKRKVSGMPKSKNFEHISKGKQ